MVASLAAGTARLPILCKAMSVGFRELREFVLRKIRRRGVGRLTNRIQLMGRTCTFKNLAKGKKPVLKMRSRGRTIRYRIRCKSYMVIQPGNEVVAIAVRLNCRWIGQPVKGSPNDHQAQQTYPDLEAHILLAGPWRGKCVACCETHSQILPEVILRSIDSGSNRAISFCLFDARNAVGVACMW